MQNFQNHISAIHTTHRNIEQFITSRNASDYLKKRWSHLNNEFKEAVISDAHDIHLIITCTGSGKTGTSCLWVKNLSRMSYDVRGYVILSAEYQHGVDEIERQLVLDGIEDEYVRFEGKNRLCTQLTKTVREGITLADINKCGISIDPYCEICEDLEECEYKNNCSRLIEKEEFGGCKKWISVSHEINCFLPIFLKHTGKIILVIDEDFRNAIKTHYTIKVPTLNKNIEFLSRQIIIQRNKGKEEDSYLEFLMGMYDLLTIFKDGIFDIKEGLDYDIIEDLIEDLDIYNSSYHQKKLSKDAFHAVKNGMRPFKFIFPQINNFMSNYFYEKLIIETPIQEWLTEALLKIKSKYRLSFLYYDKYNLNKIVNHRNIEKIFINDATANINIISCLLEDNIEIKEHNENWLYKDATFFQLCKKVNNKDDREFAHYPKESMTYKSTFFTLMNDLRAVIKKHPDEKILVVAREISEELLPFVGMSLSEYISTLSPNISFEDYPLKGTNIYADYNVVVILGKPDLPRAVINRESVLLGMEKEFYRKEYSRTNIIQAIGRIMRGDAKKFVYLITGFDIGLDVNIRKYKSHQDWIEGMTLNISLKKIEEYIEKNDEIDANKCSELLGKSYKKSMNFLKKCADLGYLQKKRGLKNRILFYKDIW